MITERVSSAACFAKFHMRYADSGHNIWSHASAPLRAPRKDGAGGRAAPFDAGGQQTMLRQRVRHKLDLAHERGVVERHDRLQREQARLHG